MRLISAHVPIAKDYDARVAFIESLSKYLVHPYRVFLFIDTNSRPPESVSTARSGNNTYLREAASQFFLSHDDMTSIHSICNFAEATAETRTSHSANMSHAIDYVAVKQEDAAGILCAATLPSVDNWHMVQEHVPSLATFIFQATADHHRPHCKRARVTEAQLQDPVNRTKLAKELE